MQAESFPRCEFKEFCMKPAAGVADHRRMIFFRRTVRVQFDEASVFSPLHRDAGLAPLLEAPDGWRISRTEV
jgi:hypothetical protein